MFYLYNGIKLPKVPVVEGYPNVFIVHNASEEKYTLYMSKETPTYGDFPSDPTGVIHAIFLSGDTELMCVLDGDSWGEITEKNISSVTITSVRSAVWTNTDLYTTDGTLYLAASDPIPIYSYQEWIIAADETGDAVLQNGYTKPTGSEWYIYSEATDTTQLPADNMVWTNTTMHNTDGSVYLEASKGIWLIDLKEFLSGFGISLACNPRNNTGKAPTAYLYGRVAGEGETPTHTINGVDYVGAVLPPLPEWDREAYPYVYVNGNWAYALSAPAIRVKASWSGNYILPDAPYLKTRVRIEDETNKIYWVAWEEITESEEDYLVPVWANHDILKNDGTVVLSASEPVPLYLPLVLFEGEVTTVPDPDYDIYPNYSMQLITNFVVGDTIRITINGETDEYTPEYVSTSRRVQIGNAGLNGNDSEVPDDGGDWLIASVYSSDGKVCFFTRTAGTYQLKIERIA